VLASKSGTKEERENREGQALVEFAFVFLFMVLVILGIIDFARLFFAYATMSNGAREGARYGIVHPPDDAEDPTDPNIQATISHAEAMIVVIGSEAAVSVEYPGGDGDSGDDPEEYPAGCTTPHHCRIQVIVTSDFDMWTPIIPSLSLEAQSTMHFE
jgi:cbb3-type cytochrome oxidase subunit 3